MENWSGVFLMKELALSKRTPAKMVIDLSKALILAAQDYQGQKKAQRIAELILLLGTIAAFIAGYLKQDLLLSDGVFAVFFSAGICEHWA